jgi:hypothetical protein
VDVFLAWQKGFGIGFQGFGEDFGDSRGHPMITTLVVGYAGLGNACSAGQFALGHSQFFSIFSEGVSNFLMMAARLVSCRGLELRGSAGVFENNAAHGSDQQVQGIHKAKRDFSLEFDEFFFAGQDLSFP